MKILSVMTHDTSKLTGPPSEEEMARMGALIEEMKGKGVLIQTGGHMPGSLEVRISRKNGQPDVTDGPFTEAKEMVGGFAVLDVKDRDDAIYWTNRFLELVPSATCHLTEVDFP